MKKMHAVPTGFARNPFRSIRSRVLIVQVPLLLCLIAMMFVMITGTLEQALTESVRETQKVQLELVDERLNEQLDTCEAVARLVLMLDEVQDVLRQDNQRAAAGGRMRTGSTQRIVNALYNSVYNLHSISSIYIYNNHGDLCHVNYRFPVEYTVDIAYEDFVSEPWFQKAHDPRGYELFLPYDVFGKDSQAFSCVKVLNDSRSFDKIGFMVINFRSEVLNSILKTETEYESVALVAASLDGAESAQNVEYNAGGGNAIASSMRNTRANWWIIYETLPTKVQVTVSAFSGRAMKWIVLFACLMIAGLILVLFFGTAPLQRLRKAIVNARKDTYQSESISFGNDEVGEIGREFKRLMDEKVLLDKQIAHLEIQQRDAELHLLQEQINPHFLYNTLDCIYWKAVKHDQPQIARMIEALSNTFKIRLGKGMNEVQVRDEIRFIEEFMYIQKMRFGDRIDLDIQISEEAMNCTIQRLMLQPFLENAVYHGLEPKAEGGLVRVRGYADGDMLHFEITDNGIGSEDSSRFYRGFGIQNVCERIRLKYGDRGGVHIDSEAGRGTMVTLWLPKGV